MSLTLTQADSFTVYSTNSCAYCKQAKALITKKKYGLVERYIDVDPEAKKVLFERLPDVKTVPQIFLGNTHIGGYKELVELIGT